MSKEALDIQIIDFIKRRGGKVRVGYLHLMFDHYSKGYLYDRIQVLKRCGLITELCDEYKLTEKGMKEDQTRFKESRLSTTACRIAHCYVCLKTVKRLCRSERDILTELGDLVGNLPRVWIKILN